MDHSAAVVCLDDDESERLAALESSGGLSMNPQELCGDIPRHVKKLLNVQACVVSFMSADTCVIKDEIGLSELAGGPILELPRHDTYCQHTIMYSKPLVVPDCRKDKRFQGLSAVRDLHLVFYAGTQIMGGNNKAIGTVCVLDTEPRSNGDFAWPVLEIAAQAITKQLRLARAKQDATRFYELSEKMTRQVSALSQRGLGEITMNSNSVRRKQLTKEIIEEVMWDIVDLLDVCLNTLACIDIFVRAPSAELVIFCAILMSVTIPLWLYKQAASLVRILECRREIKEGIQVRLSRVVPSGLSSDALGADGAGPDCELSQVRRRIHRTCLRIITGFVEDFPFLVLGIVVLAGAQQRQPSQATFSAGSTAVMFASCLISTFASGYRFSNITRFVALRARQAHLTHSAVRKELEFLYS